MRCYSPPPTTLKPVSQHVNHTGTKQLDWSMEFNVSVALRQIYQSLVQQLSTTRIAALYALEILNFCVALETFCPTILLHKRCTINFPMERPMTSSAFPTWDARGTMGV